MYKVLVLDNDQEARWAARKFPWIRYGFDIPMEASTGAEALDLLAQGDIDLLVTDVTLPDMDGLELLERLGEHTQSPCVVLLSCVSNFELAQQGLAQGAFEYVVKPFSAQSFGSVLQRVEIFLKKMVGLYKEDGSLPEPSPALKQTLQLKRRELSELLLKGDLGFLSEARKWTASCGQLPEMQGRALLFETLNSLHDSFDQQYPWVKNIEAAAPEEMDSPEDFLKAVQKLYDKLDRYELLKRDSLFRSICVVVQENIEQGISLGLVAEQLGISTDYAGRIFKRYTGEHFAAFVMRTKMERGKELLRDGRLRNYEISTRLGYSNPDYFRQLFKNYTGMTPNEYRNSFRTKILH